MGQKEIMPPNEFELYMAHNALDQAIEQGIYDEEPIWLISFLTETSRVLVTDTISSEDLLALSLTDGEGTPITADDLQEMYNDPTHVFMFWDEAVIVPLKPESSFHTQMLAVARDTLCWVLGHEGGRHFEENLATLLEAMGKQERGVEG